MPPSNKVLGMGEIALPTFDLRLVTPFAVLGQLLHFGRAAQALGIAQPALSRQILRLELQLGVKLLVRGPRGVTLTPAGARFLVESQGIVERARDLEARLTPQHSELRAHIGLSVHPLVRSVVAAFAAEYPEIQLHVSEGPGSECMQALINGTADASFDLAQGAPSGMTVVPVDSSPLGVVCTRAHALARHGAAGWGELDGETVFVAPPGIADAWNELVRECVHAAGANVIELVGPRVTRAMYLLDSIRAGAAVLITPEYAPSPLPDGLVWIGLEPPRQIEVGIVFDERNPSVALAQLVNHVRDYSLLHSEPRTAGTGTSGG
jgi:DNA-binding transcriptional LysR family regulator